MVASFWLCILPTNRRWPAAATPATIDDADEAGKDAGCDCVVPVGLVTQLAPAGRPGAVQRGRQHAPPPNAASSATAP